MNFYSLEKIKELSPQQAARYCRRIRALLVETVTQNGGHLASNLGVTEISVALARTLCFPRDRVIYDTGHQSYVHKITTDRAEAFSTLRRFGGISGFPRREESSFDVFGTGHSGTALSAALGFSRADRLSGKDGWNVVVLGDGAFTGGMVFEALNNISRQDRVIVILNDNGMSIQKSVGTWKNVLNRMRTAGYYRFKGGVERSLQWVPTIAAAAKKVKDSVKRSALPTGNLFEQMGLHYFGPADGNHLPTVEFLLREAMKKNRPAVIHLCTKKGKGYEAAEKSPSRFHGVSPNEKKSTGKSFSQCFSQEIVKLAEKDSAIVAVTAAMADGVGLCDFAKAYPNRFFDVGIAEEHAVTFSAGLAAAGLKPCFAVYSTFFQRSYDQLLHDAALQKLPLVLVLDRAGLCGEDGATHHGLFDLPLALSVPKLKIYAPSTAGELTSSLQKAFAEKESSSLIRYPKACAEMPLPTGFTEGSDAERVDFGKPKVAIVTFGRMILPVAEAAENLRKKKIGCAVIRFLLLKGFDRKQLEDLFFKVDKIVFVEEGIREGGFSEHLLSLLQEEGLISRAKILAVEDSFVPHGSTQQLFSYLGFDAQQIEKEVEAFVKT